MKQSRKVTGGVILNTNTLRFTTKLHYPASIFAYLFSYSLDFPATRPVITKFLADKSQILTVLDFHHKSTLASDDEFDKNMMDYLSYLSKFCKMVFINLSCTKSFLEGKSKKIKV